MGIMSRVTYKIFLFSVVNLPLLKEGSLFDLAIRKKYIRYLFLYVVIEGENRILSLERKITFTLK